MASVVVPMIIRAHSLAGFTGAISLVISKSYSKAESVMIPWTFLLVPLVGTMYDIEMEMW